MKKFVISAMMAGLLCFPRMADAQYRAKEKGEKPVTEVDALLEKADSSEAPVLITLEQALQIALSENVSVKVADKEIERTGFARKGTYAALFPQIDVSGNYQRTIKKQVMYMDIDMSKMGGAAGGDSAGAGSEGSAPEGAEGGASASMADGLEVGRWNTWSAGVTAAMPIVNAQLWESIKISGTAVELAVEKARESRLNMVTQVKSAFYATLLAKEAFNVYREVYENAVKNYEETEKKYNAQKASELDLTRAKTTVANAVPNVYNAESSVILALWQLKAVLGVDLDANVDVAGELSDYADTMFRDLHQNDSVTLDNNTTMKQLALQAEQLARNIRLQKYAYIPTLSAAFSFSVNAMTNDFKFDQYKWTPYSYVGVSLSIPIFSGGKRLNDVRQAKNQYQQLQLQTTDTERTLKIAIRQSLNTMETNMKSYYAAQTAVATAQKGYDIAEKSYQVGRSTLIELNDAQLALTQARLSESQAIYNFIVAKAQLEQVIGNDFIE
ncbi:MAG: TolC family protein [Bacteroidales bacterium]|nr:TolC family protein [Bacteroidales bacterium]